MNITQSTTLSLKCVRPHPYPTTHKHKHYW